MEVKVIYLEDCKCLLRLLNLKALFDLQGKTEECGDLIELGAEAVLELGDVTHSLHSWQSPSPLWGLGELEYKPLPDKLHLGLLTLHLPPWIGGYVFSWLFYLHIELNPHSTVAEVCPSAPGHASQL